MCYTNKLALPCLNDFFCLKFQCECNTCIHLHYTTKHHSIVNNYVIWDAPIAYELEKVQRAIWQISPAFYIRFTGQLFEQCCWANLGNVAVNGQPGEMQGPRPDRNVLPILNGKVPLQHCFKNLPDKTAQKGAPSIISIKELIAER